MTQNEFDAMAVAMGVPVPSDYAAGVAEQWHRFAAVAKLVTDFELPLEAEPAAVFDASMPPDQ